MYLCRHFWPLLIFCQQNVSRFPVLLILFFMGFRIRAVLGRHIKRFTIETIEEVTFSRETAVCHALFGIKISISWLHSGLVVH